jgi:hypothetical protein
MHCQGIVIGLVCFLVIGLFHPLVIKGEYYFGVKIWWAFLLAGLAATAMSLFIADVVVSAVLGVIGFSCFWSIREVFHQRKRVEKGWFPAGPSHREKENKK